MMGENKYAVTSQESLRGLLDKFIPKDVWINITDIYDNIESNITEFKPNDFDVLAEYNQQPKWKRNIRNALQTLKKNDSILWDGNQNYLFPSDISVEIESSRLPLKQGLNEEQFYQILERKKEIGRKGEEFVVDFERKALTAAGRTDLIDKVKRISIENVSAGFDILSFDENGNEKSIEVKTTIGKGYSFELTINELEKSKKIPNYFIYFIREFNPGNDKLEPIIITGNNLKQIELKPSSFKATLTTKLKDKTTYNKT